MSAPTQEQDVRTKRGEVVVSGISCDFHGNRVLHETDLVVEAGEFFTLLGPSGSGKTTLLRIIAGLIEPSEGSIYVDGREVTNVATQQRDIGFVFQNYALFPHLTVEQNIAFGLKVRKVRKPMLQKRIDEMLELTELGALRDRMPSQLSGGQQQRVALGRALAQRPRVLLLDEPLGALDRRLRQDLGAEIRRIQQESDTTAIYVTHDQEEAYILSDRMGVMDGGYINQVGKPAEVYRSPANQFVAKFLGETNNFTAEVLSKNGDAVTVGVQNYRVTARAAQGLQIGDACVVSSRPEHVELVPSFAALSPGFEAIAQVRIADVRFFGQTTRVRLVDDQGSYVVDLESHHDQPSVGAEVIMGVRAGTAVALAR